MSNRLPPLCGSPNRDPHDRGSMPGCSCTPGAPILDVDPLLNDAACVIDADPLLSAVSRFALGWVADPTPQNAERQRAAAITIVASRNAPPEPAKTWTVDEARRLLERVAALRRDIDAIRDPAFNLLHDLQHRDLDPTARAATEGALRRACERLAALLGGAK